MSNAKVIVHVLPGSPEEVKKNRQVLEKVIEAIESRKEGRPMKVSLL